MNRFSPFATVGADFLITGDHELLKLGRIGKTRIIPPSGYWKIL